MVSETGANAYYAKKLVQRLLNYGDDAAYCHLQCEGFVEGSREEPVENITNKHGPDYYKSRLNLAKRFANSQWVTFSSKYFFFARVITVIALSLQQAWLWMSS